MIRTIIVEDNYAASDYLVMQLEKRNPSYHICAVCTNVASAITHIQNQKPDLVFLDIDLGENENGFTIVEQTEDIPYHVILTTGHPQYAIDAVQYDCIDYLIKPYTNQDLEIALARHASAIQSEFSHRRKVLLQNHIIHQQNILKYHFPLKGKGIVEVKLKEIKYCEAQSNYCIFYLTENRKHTIIKQLKQVDAELGEAGFYRVHESFLINTEHIVEIEDKLNNAHVYLPEKVPIARNRKVDFLNHLNNSRIKMF